MPYAAVAGTDGCDLACLFATVYHAAAPGLRALKTPVGKALQIPDGALQRGKKRVLGSKPMLFDATAEVQHADLVTGLRARPRWIPSKYFYDDRGSALFDEICDLPEYYPTRTEQKLLDEIAPEVARITRANELVELGSGTARKTRTLIAALLDQGERLHYVPLDISEYALEQAASAVAAEFPEVRVTPLVCDYTRSLDVFDPDPGCLTVFLGSTIGNFNREQAVALLRRLGDRLNPGDYLLLGLDLVKPVEVLEAAYNDAAGVTAEFNRNILLAVNAETGGNFDPQAYDHVAFFDQAKKHIEMHLVARREQTVRLETLDLELEIDAGESIRTEISRKFTRDIAERLLTDAGFCMRRWFISGDRYFALALVEIVDE